MDCTSIGFSLRKERLTMRKHARETIRRPREIETSYDWDLDEKTMPKKVARKPKDDDFDDEDLFESEEEEL